MKTGAQDAKNAARALANLNAWSAVVALLEGGLLAGPHVHTATTRVIKIAETEIQKELKRYDAAIAAIKGPA